MTKRAAERHGGRGRVAARLGVAVVAACLAVSALTFNPGGVVPEKFQGLYSDLFAEQLEPQESLADERDSQPVAAGYSEESFAQFQDALHIEDASGRQLALADVPQGSYSGFIFQIDGSAADGTAAKLAEAEEQGMVRHLGGGSYSVESLDTLASLLDCNQVTLLEPDFTLHLVGDLDEDTGSLNTHGGTERNPAPDWPPSDPDYLDGMLWHLDMLNVQGAWERGLDGDPYVYNNTPVRDTPVKVAIIDTGLYGTGGGQAQHEDFDYSRIEPGYNFISDTPNNAPDAKGHGTFVAGLIAAQVSNGVGVAGLQPGVTLVPEKVFDTGSASTSDVIAAIYHSVDEADADVINMSLGGEYNEATLEDACDYAVDAGVLVVASAGNDGVTTPNYPAAYDSVVGVGSVDSSKNRSSWSQSTTKNVFVTAPGESVTSTYNEGPDSYKTASGTSFSGPEVAALGALCKSVYPEIDQDTFKEFLIETSEDLGQQGRDMYYGYGLVNFDAMAKVVLDSQTLPWYELSFDVTGEDGRAVEGATIALSAAEDISWEAWNAADNPGYEGASYEAGSLAEGDMIEPDPEAAEPMWGVHRGMYNYKISAPGKYTVTGRIKTFAAHQVTSVTLPDAYATTVSVTDSAGEAVDGVELKVSSAARTEDPTSHEGNNTRFDLASGGYAYEASAPGYETARASFTVQRSAKDVHAVLYRSEEMTDVSFACTASDDGRSLTNGLVLTVVDEWGSAIPASEDGAWRLAQGKTYTVTAVKVGFDDTSVTFTVADGGQVVPIALTAALNTVTFVVVDASGAPISSALAKVADSDGASAEPWSGDKLRFSLAHGAYTYEVSAPGYETKTGSFTLATQSSTIRVTLPALSHVVSFNVVDAATGAALDGASIKVSTASTLRAIPAASDGTWLLEPGSYRYVIYKDGYEVAQDTFSVAGDDLAVNVELRRRTQETTEFAGGSGTAEDPYLIATEDQLHYLADSTQVVRMTNTQADTNQRKTITGYYRLVNDIELTREWTPIGNEENSSNYVRFGGDFDGAGHTVSNVWIDQPGNDCIGFFGSVVGAHIHDLTISGSGIAGKSYVGGLVGRVYYTYSSEYPSYNTPATLIERCGNEVDVAGKSSVGGICGSAQATNQDNAGSWVDPGTGGGITVDECYNTGDVCASESGAFTRGSTAAGGIVGSGQQIIVTNCYNRGAVQAGYNAGGLVGNSRLNCLFTCYNAGLVGQYVTASGYGGTAGGIVGNSYYNLASDCYWLNAEGNTGNGWGGAVDSATIHTNCDMREHDQMYRTATFVDAVNFNARTGEASAAFVLGRDYPLLSWQVAPDVLLAPAPYVTEQPQGIAVRDAYKVGDEAAPLAAAAAPVEAGTVTWAWYADGVPVEGATGTGLAASFTPPTSAPGVVMYHCVFTNSLSTETASDSASVSTQKAAVYVRSATDAQAPVITALNPSQTSAFNSSVTVKCGTDAVLRVQAEVADGGELSYQWYSSEDGTGTGEAIDGATESTYNAPSSAEGKRHYYVEVTNTTELANSSTTVSDWITLNVLPYTIDDYEDLAAFRTAVNSGTNFYGLTVTLTADIRIPDGVSWEPIGSGDHPFSGTFMGGAGYASSSPDEVVTHSITNVHVDGDMLGNRFCGLFGYTLDAKIFDVQVQGDVTGAHNQYAGMLVGYASTYNATVTDAYIENCTVLEGSSVEGEYLVGGAVGASGSHLTNVANHGAVHAHAFERRVPSNATGIWSVGGVVGYEAGQGELIACYNTGEVAVDTVGAAGSSTEYCAEYVGGVAGYTGPYAGIYTAFNAGTLTIPQVSKASNSSTRGAVRFAGSTAGYVSYGSSRCANLHYLEGTYSAGANNDLDTELADYHSMPFMKTGYFIDMLANGYAGYAPSHFATSSDGVPHFVWEAENVDEESDGQVHSAEPWLIDVQSVDMPSITSSWKGTYYEGGVANPIYVLAESADGGALSFRWQQRAASGNAGADAGWTDIPGTSETTQIRLNGNTYEAGLFTVPVDTVQTKQYRCVVSNKRDGAVDELESAIPAITIDVRPADEGLFLRDSSQPNSADNPWVIDTPVRMKLFADLVNGVASLPGLPDSTFAGQYVVLDADIDLSAYEQWTPIGAYSSYRSTSFAGNFDGQHHVVSGLSIDRRDDGNYTGHTNWSSDEYTALGLFGSTYLATIGNVEVCGSVYADNGRYTSTTNNAWMTAGVVGYAYGSYVHDVVNRVTVIGYEGVGGVVGYAENSRIASCENQGTVTVNESAKSSRYKGILVGGVVGYSRVGASASGSGAGVFDCFNGGSVLGRVTTDGDYRFGAVVGEISGDAPVENCYYEAGSVASWDGTGATPTGIGAGNNVKKPRTDVSGTVELLDPAALEMAQATAWLLNVGGAADEATGACGLAAAANGDAAWSNSGKWGCYIRADLNDEAPRVHLICGSGLNAVYRVDRSCESAAITAKPLFATPGTPIVISWEAKDGFAVSSVAAKPDGLWMGEGVSGSGSFVMPASDVGFTAEAEKDDSHVYEMSGRVLLDGVEAPSAGTVSFARRYAHAGATANVTLSVAEGYQVASVYATDKYGTAIALTRVDGLHYRFAVPAADVTVTMVVEPDGSVAVTRAPSLEVDKSAAHRWSADATDDLLYETLVFSGTFFGEEIPLMAYELEGSTNPGLYQQRYTFADGSEHAYTGIDLAEYIQVLGSEIPDDDTQVLVECADGSVTRFAYGELAALTRNSYDASGQPDVRGLPALLFFGVDGVPNADGAFGLVLGQTSASDDNAARMLTRITRICVGEDVDYSMHMWYVTDGDQTIDFGDMDQISGGTTDAEMGQTTLHVRLYSGNKEDGRLVRENTMTLPEIEALATADRAGIAHGYYSTYLYEDGESASSGPFTDYYEGYDLWKVLEACGVPYEDSLADSRVQFYQSGMNGLENSWKTINVSLGYLAGNGPAGAGDYSGNIMRYAGDGYVSSGRLTGLRPLLVYGKNGLPLVWSSGTEGVGQFEYNYRGPMMALLPQNAAEGGSFVGSQTSTACYLALVDVYLPEDYEIEPDPADLTGLKAAIEKVEALDAADYTPESWVSVTEALNAAKALTDKDSQEAVDAAAKALNDAIAALKSAQTERWLFDDVKNPSSWYFEWVYVGVDAGLVSGYSGKNLFGPNDKITRGQVATILWRAAGEPAATSAAGFADVKTGQYYTEAVNWAAETGVVTGYVSGKSKTFKPNANVTRQDMVLMLSRYVAQAGGDTGGSDAWKSKPGAGKVASYAQAAIAWGVDAGVIGSNGAALNPTSNATRAEATKMLLVGLGTLE